MYEEGDTVTVLDKCSFNRKYGDNPDEHPDWIRVGYTEDMPRYFGRTGVIQEVSRTGNLDLFGWWWPKGALVPQKLTTKLFNNLVTR